MEEAPLGVGVTRIRLRCEWTWGTPTVHSWLHQPSRPGSQTCGTVSELIQHANEPCGSAGRFDKARRPIRDALMNVPKWARGQEGSSLKRPPTSTVSDEGARVVSRWRRFESFVPFLISDHSVSSADQLLQASLRGRISAHRMGSESSPNLTHGLLVTADTKRGLPLRRLISR